MAAVLQPTQPTPSTPDTTAAQSFGRDGPPPAQPAEPKLEGQELFNALQNQLEFYFSRQNLSTDAYLISQMNSQKYVPVDVIANFRKVKSMTEDKELLVQVMRTCKNLVANEEGTMVRPNLKMERNTLILRDIPSSTPLEEVKAIFDDKCGKVVNIRSDVGDTWFVTFETQDQCMDTCLHLSNKTFKGNRIACRVKSENLLRGFYYPMGAPQGSKPATPTGSPTSEAQRWRGPHPGPMGNGYYQQTAPMAYMGPPYGHYNNMIPQHYNQQWTQNFHTTNPAQAQNAPPHHGQQHRIAQTEFQKGDRRANNRTREPKRGKNRGAVNGQGKNRRGNANKPFNRKFNNQDQQNQQSDSDSQSQSQSKQSRKGRNNQSAAPSPQLREEDFPALPTNATKVKQVGYEGQFLCYDRETMASIVAQAVSGKAPESFPSAKDEGAVVSEEPLDECQLLEPFPVMYPASPSPLFAAQTHHSSEIPFLDLDLSNPYLPPELTMGGYQRHAAGASKGKGKTKGKKGKGGKGEATGSPANGAKRKSFKGSRKSSSDGAQKPLKYAQKGAQKGARKQRSNKPQKNGAPAEPTVNKPAVTGYAAKLGSKPKPTMASAVGSKPAGKPKQSAQRPTAAAIVAGTAKAPVNGDKSKTNKNKHKNKHKGKKEEGKRPTAADVVAGASKSKANQKQQKQGKQPKARQQAKSAKAAAAPAKKAEAKPKSATPKGKMSYADMLRAKGN
jgi:hypothetical protein